MRDLPAPTDVISSDLSSHFEKVECGTLLQIVQPASVPCSTDDHGVERTRPTFFFSLLFVLHELMITTLYPARVNTVGNHQTSMCKKRFVGANKKTYANIYLSLRSHPSSPHEAILHLVVFFGEIVRRSPTNQSADGQTIILTEPASRPLPRPSNANGTGPECVFLEEF